MSEGAPSSHQAENGRSPDAPVRDAGARAPSPAQPGEFTDPDFAFRMAERWASRGYLPHFDRSYAVQFVTFRLGDALPQEILTRIAGLSTEDTVGRWRESETALDAGYGSQALKYPDCARILIGRLLHGHGENYELHAWCVMPNHVHVLLHMRDGHRLGDEVESWKSVSTRLMRELYPQLPRRLWQEDYFDRFIRDEGHYLKTVRYIEENPVHAGLVGSPGEWKWGSASLKVSSGAGEGDRAPAGRMRADALRRRLLAPLEERAAKSLERRLSARPAEPAWRCLADNDYLGLSRDPEVIAAGKAALDRWGASASASPLITGYTGEHAALERELGAWCGFAHGLVWNTGFAANAAVLGSLPKPGDLVLSDRLIHASMISGILASGARLVRYGHNDLGRLRELLEKHRDHDGVVWVVTESVFSMDGDYPDLREIAALKAEFGFVLVVDEAHATGWYGATGAGLVEREGVAGSVDILVGTLGKGLGGMGAYTLFHDDVFRRHLVNFAGEFVYSTYLAPASAACARAAIRRVRAMRAGGLDTAGLSRRWREALREVVPDTPEGDSPVIPVPLGDAARVMRVAERLLDSGWKVGAVRPPTVPEGGARLRLSLNLGLDEKAPAEFAEALRRALRD